MGRRHYFFKVDLNKLWHDVQNEETLICAKFGKDLFNISKVIGRKKVAQFFLDSQCIYANKTKMINRPFYSYYQRKRIFSILSVFESRFLLIAKKRSAIFQSISIPYPIARLPTLGIVAEIFPLNCAKKSKCPLVIGCKSLVLGVCSTLKT